jgi:hypothetical protein
MIGMFYFAKPVLTEDLYIMKREEFSVTCYMKRTLGEKPSIFVRDKLIFSSEMMLLKGYDRKGSVVNLKGLGAKTN